MTKKYNWKKWPIILVVVVGVINVFQHNYYKENIGETFTQGLERIDYSSPKINDVRLPISFTLLAKKVESEILFEDSNLVDNVTVTLTPMGTLPFVWFLFDSAYHLDTTQKEIDKILDLKNPSRLIE